MSEVPVLLGGSSPLVLPAVITYGRRVYQLVVTARNRLTLRACEGPEVQQVIDSSSRRSI